MNFDGYVELTAPLPDSAGHECDFCGDICNARGETSQHLSDGEITFICEACLVAEETYRRCNCGVGEGDF